MTGSVLIVGCGIAGRAVARVLAQYGLGCTIVERRALPPVVGWDVLDHGALDGRADEGAAPTVSGDLVDPGHECVVQLSACACMDVSTRQSMI